MSVPTRTVYVGNISFSATAESLMESLVDYEPISIKVIDGKGIAFVEVPARRAFGVVRDLDGSKLDGRMISVSIATPRENEPTFTQEQDQERKSRDQERRDGGGYRDNDRGSNPNPRFANRDDSRNGGYRDRPQGPIPRESFGDRDRSGPRRYGSGPDRGPSDQRNSNDRPGYDRRPNPNRSESGPGRPPYQNRDRFEGNRDPGRFDQGPRPDQGRQPEQNRDDRPPYSRDGGRPDFNRGGFQRPSGRNGGRFDQDRPAREPFRRDQGPNRDPSAGERDRGAPGGEDRPQRPAGEFGGFKPPYKPKSGYNGANRGSQSNPKPKKFFKKR